MDADPGKNDDGATSLGDNDASLRDFENLEAKAASSSSFRLFASIWAAIWG